LHTLQGKQRGNVEMVWLGVPRALQSSAAWLINVALLWPVDKYCRIGPKSPASHPNARPATKPNHSSSQRFPVNKPCQQHEINAIQAWRAPCKEFFHIATNVWLLNPNSRLWHFQSVRQGFPFPFALPPLTTMAAMPMPLNKCHYIVKCILAP